MALGPPKRGEQRTFRLKKKKGGHDKGRPPAPGERKALRKRIVLSNTNAIEVHGMQDLSAETMIDMRLRGQMLGIPGPVVDQLRAVEAFKVSQGWGLFRRPGTLIRKETLAYGKLFDSLNSLPTCQNTRRILVGEKGSGKSMLLLQAMSMAFLKDWIVISIPDGKSPFLHVLEHIVSNWQLLLTAIDLTNGHTSYSPLPGSTPIQYVQKTYLTTFLSSIVRSNNSILANLTLAHTHTLPGNTSLQSNLSLSRLVSLGASDPELAWPIFLALWRELSTPSTSAHPRPPILLTIDGLGHAMRLSAYLSSSFTPIHAHDLALVSWFMEYLSGAKSLSNGGMILAATSESNHPSVPSLKLRLAQLEAQQSTASSASLTLVSPIDAFLQATGQDAAKVPEAAPFTKYDERVMRVLSNEGNNIEIQRLEGLSRDEARGLMEYWAKSGVLRQTVSEGLVGEKWTISGGGVVGELERGCIRMRV